MKASETKPSAKPASKPTPFFSKENGPSFFGSNGSDAAFFPNPTSHATVQPKLTIGQQNDKYEQEADAMADKVVQRLTKHESVQTKPLESNIYPDIQTKCAACEHEAKLQNEEGEGDEPVHTKLQRKAALENNLVSPVKEKPVQRKCEDCEKEEKLQAKTVSTTLAASPVIENNLASAKGSGDPLPTETRNQMEASFGADFSEVRIHNNNLAVKMSKDLNAQAFTHGNDIYFNSGKYDPISNSGKHLLAHELTHTIQQGQRGGKVIQNKEIRTICNPYSNDKPETTPNAANILMQGYSHLAKVITYEQLEKFQKVIDAQEKVTELKEKQKPFRDRISFGYGGRGGSSEDIRDYDYFQGKIDSFNVIIAKNNILFIDSKLLAADDILDSGVEWSPPIQAFHEQLYKRFIENPVRITVNPCLAYENKLGQFLNFSWQSSPGNYWDLSHDNGLIRFKNLMFIETLNYNYQQVLYGEQVKILGKMLTIRREIGDYYPEPVGKRIGILDEGLFSDTTVNVGSEIGDTHGYYNDSRGRMDLFSALYGPQLNKYARVVLRSESDWFHIFATDPNFDTTEMDDPIGERGWLYILTQTKSPDLEITEFITKDGRELKPDITVWSGPGWKTERELSEFEEFAIGAIFGDAFESNSGSAMFGQILMSVIPIVGQIADARDVAVGIHKIYTSGGKEGKLQTAFAMIGFVPVFGDYIKNEAKVAKNATPEIKAAVHTEAVQKASTEIGEEVAAQGAKKIEDAVGKGGKQGAEDALGTLPGVKKEFVQNVMNQAGKIDELAPGLKQADEVSGEASTAFGRQLPDLENPKLVAQGAFKIGEEVHFVKVVQIGNWKQVWICTQCGSLIAKIDEALIGADAAVSDQLKRLRNSAVELERKVNTNKIKPTDVDKKVGRITFEINEMARKNPAMGGLAKVLHDDLVREYLKLYKVASINDLTPGAKAALSKNYRPTPPGYHWRLADDGNLQVVRNPNSENLSKLKYNEETHRFELDEAVSESKKFETQLTPAEAFAELGGKDLKKDFGQFAAVLDKELGVSAKKLIDDLELQNTKGFKDALQDTVRHRLKEPYVDMLYAKITDPAHLVNTSTYKAVLQSTKDPAKALRAASHEELLRVSRQLGNSDKGSLGERWFKEWFASRGDEIKTQVKLGPEHGILHEATRRVDIYEDHLAREVKNVTTNLGADGTKQVEDLLAGVGKDVKVGGSVTGYDSVRLVFIDPIGGAANAKWMIENLKKFKDSPLSFQVMNKEGVPLIINASELVKHGDSGLEKIILNWTN